MDRQDSVANWSSLSHVSHDALIFTGTFRLGFRSGKGALGISVVISLISCIE